MKVLIFEDEALTAERLIILLKRHATDIEVLDVLESVKQGITWFQKNPEPDLIFMDIHLADGSGFEIFAEIKINTPVIFTTAYDKYAIQAFKVNCIDYLLKPIDFEELNMAINKFKNLKWKPQNDNDIYRDFLKQMMKSYKQRFLVKTGEQYKYISTEEIAYFIYDESLVFAYTIHSKRFIVDESIEKLETLLNPEHFYRINRKMIISLQSIVQIHKYINNRLLLRLKPDIQTDVIVSRDKAPDFKKWLNK